MLVYVGVPKIWGRFVQLQVPYKLCCAPRAPAVRNLGARAPASCMAPALMACTIDRGVRQGCSLSPLLYLIYDEAMTIEATDNMETGISVGGRIINTIRYADGKAVVANSQKGSQQLILQFT